MSFAPNLNVPAPPALSGSAFRVEHQRGIVMSRLYAAAARERRFMTHLDTYRVPGLSRLSAQEHSMKKFLPGAAAMIKSWEQGYHDDDYPEPEADYDAENEEFEDESVPDTTDDVLDPAVHNPQSGT